MDVGERRKAQLGATTYLIGETKQRLRLSSVGDFSESRELGNSFFCTDLVNKLNIFFFPHQLNEIEASCQKRGLYLFSGPVGSGKKQQPCIVWLKRSGEQQVIAIEDPVEIEEKRFFYSCKQMKKFS